MTEYAKIKIKELVKVPIIVPEIQRIQDKERIKDIVSYQKKYHTHHSTYNFMGVITLVHLQPNNQYYIIDGQHRYQAMLQLHKQKLDTNIPIALEIRTRHSKDELETDFKIINKSLPAPKLPESLNRSLYEEVYYYYEEMYPSFFSNSERPRRPNLHKKYFKEAIAILIQQLNISHAHELISVIQKINQQYQQYTPEQFIQKGKTSNQDLLLKCKLKGGFLSLIHI